MNLTGKIYNVATGIGYYILAFLVMLLDTLLKSVLLRRPR